MSSETSASPSPSPCTGFCNDLMDALFQRLYGELQRRAINAFRREPPGHPLEPTALVHEVFLRLRRQRIPPRNREHFLALASLTMQRILISDARQRRRRGDEIPLEGKPLTAQPLATGSRRSEDRCQAEARGSNFIPGTTPRAERRIVVRQALGRLRARYPRPYRVVRLRFLGGLENREIARQLGTSLATVKRDWVRARSFLLTELQRPARAGFPRRPAR